RHQGTGPMTRRALIGMLIACGGCFSWGTPPDKFPPALGPEGARVALRVRGESADRLGELLAVDSTGITIRGDRVITVAWPKVAALDVKDVGLDYDIVMGEPVSPEKIARLALLSRFPPRHASRSGRDRFADRRDLRRHRTVQGQASRVRRGIPAGRCRLSRHGRALAECRNALEERD